MSAMLRMLPPESSNARAQEVEVESSARGTRVAEASLPELAPVLLVGHREVDDRVEPAGERLVDVRPQVRREDRDAVERLHPLEEVGDLDVGVAVVGVLHLGALAEERVGLVEEAARR